MALAAPQPEAHVAPEPKAASCSEQTARSPRPTREQAASFRPLRPIVEVDEELPPEEREAQVANLAIDRLSKRLAAYEQSRPGADAELNFMEIATWQRGYLEGALQVSPELAHEVAHRFSTTMCDPKASDTQLLASVEGSFAVRDVIGGDGFDCIAKRGKEDIVLWTAITASRAAGLPDPPAFEQLRKSAQDERTKHRLSPPAVDQDEVANHWVEPTPDQFSIPTPVVTNSQNNK
jgi:hypothetical protein